MATHPDWLARCGLLALAERYAVPVAPWYPADAPRPPGTVMPAGAGFGISTSGELLYNAETLTSSWGSPKGLVPDVANVYHELTHILCTPPAMLNDDGLENLWEGWILLPVERAVLRQIPQPTLSQKAVAWIERRTPVLLPGDGHAGVTLDAWSHPTRTSWWRSAIARAQLVGLLDHRGALTGQRADWSRISDPIEGARLAYTTCKVPRHLRSRAS